MGNIETNLSNWKIVLPLHTVRLKTKRTTYEYCVLVTKLASYRDVGYTRIERDMCTPMFIVALFIIARTWKQPRCPLTDEWIRKLWYIYTVKYYSAIKNNSFESVLIRWMKLEPIIQSEVSQKKNTNTVY